MHGSRPGLPCSAPALPVLGVMDPWRNRREPDRPRRGDRPRRHHDRSTGSGQVLAGYIPAQRQRRIWPFALFVNAPGPVSSMTRCGPEIVRAIKRG